MSLKQLTIDRPGDTPSIIPIWELPKNSSSQNFDFGYGSFANGGFVIYPNKANTNMMRSVYAK